ncbi:MAG: family 10 glycosylhydrolase [Acidobacteria bacterium]|nr:family 10 glycosylhydrolase [Acidobacteriota bacterium]
MNSQLSRRRFLEAAVATAALPRGGFAASGPGSAPPVKLGSLSPRGSRRILYVSDPSSIARRHLPDPVSERDLRKWVDTLAAARVDLFIQEAYTQGWTTYWRSPRFDYDARPQHRRFLPLLDQGKQPLGILLDQCRRRGMTFMAGLRVNDNHGHVSIRQGVGAGAAFLVDNPQWQIRETPPGPYYALSTPFDFTFDPVREYLYSVTVELVDRFDVDGLELCFRDHFYFPPGKGPERKDLMTGLVRRIRRMLDEKGKERNRKLLLGARVFQTLEECDTMGLDVPAWIAEELIDYVSPADTMYCEPNLPLEAFSRLTRSGPCLLYPGLLPWSSIRMRRRLGGQPITLDQQRALAMNMYGAGADGIFFYNHFVPLSWAPFYPHMLRGLAETREPGDLTRGNRHYVFEPVWAGCLGFGVDKTATGVVKADKMVLKRGTPGGEGKYRFRICERVGRARGASLLFRAYHAVDGDRFQVRVNGTPVPDSRLRRRSDERRSDLKAIVDPNSTSSSGLPPVPDLPGPFSTFWFDLTEPPAQFGDNWLEVSLTHGDPDQTRDILIDEVEVFVSA